MKQLTKRLLSVLITVMMLCALLPTSAFADLITGEKFKINVIAVYEDGTVIDSTELTTTCKDTTGHSGYNHSVNIKEFYPTNVGFSTTGFKGYYKSSFTTYYGEAPSTLYSWSSGTTAIHYNITGTAPYKAVETIFLVYSHTHTWDNGTITKQPTCTETGVKTYTCSSCGETKTETIPALGHDWDDGVVTKEPTCTEPGEKTYTCRNDSSHTKTEEIPALGHDWDDGVVTKEPTCTEPGEKTYTCQNDPSHTRTEEIPALGHSDEDNDGKCDECGECLHDKDENGNCTVDDCAHIKDGDDCCTKDDVPDTEYTITYKDGDETIGTDTVTAGESATVHSAPTAPDGKEFTGWVDQDGKLYQPDDSITPTGDMTLTAQWKDSETPDNPDDPDTKDSHPSMDKQVNGGDSASVKPGDTLTYTLTSNVPDYLGDYIPADDVNEPEIQTADLDDDSEIVRGSYLLTFHDKMSSSLTFNGVTSVTVNGKALDSNLYSIREEAEDCTFEVSMDLVQIYQAGGYFTLEDITNTPAIVVTYTATLDKDATAGTYQNQAWTGYEGTTSSTDTVDADTYGIKIFKFDQADETTGLAGAQFELRDSDGTLIATLTSDETGNAQYDGLAEGSYTLTETVAPEGYVKSDKPISITISNDAGSDNYVPVRFANSAIPHTGGSGTYQYTIGGIAILGLAAVVYVISRKKQE